MLKGRIDLFYNIDIKYTLKHAMQGAPLLARSLLLDHKKLCLLLHF